MFMTSTLENLHAKSSNEMFANVNINNIVLETARNLLLARGL